ncbi:receptor-type tyrosine-protein phosphatase eta-like isoform X2 [Pecten maximus]|uniref:receptor-type tyrosine-protein phosphatase eta-like isoform X2 n=1 Tax=Pecten maximus TaxID=6579 RepID=UPI0014589F90|nr:receptor-type tyrosine-protein phosphatase eta-like isoform X2 [Pecten maximus]
MITITPIVNRNLIESSAVYKTTSFKPAKPGQLVPPTGGYIAPNTTLQWNQSIGSVDKYRIRLTPLCPRGEDSMEYTSNITDVFVTNLQHGRKYRLEITAMSGDVYSDSRTIENFTTIDIVPDPPQNVTLIPPINTTSVGIAIDPDTAVECTTLNYTFNASVRVYSDQNYEAFALESTFANQSTYILNRLYPGAMYIVWIFSKNRNFASKNPFKLPFKTAETDPGAVQNVNISTKNTSISVSFDRPNRPNGEITSYVLGVSPTPCPVLKMNRAADIDCESVQSSLFQGHTGKKGNCLCIIKTYTTPLQFDIANLLPYTSYMLIIQANNSAGLGDPVSTNATTAIGAPHIPGNVHVAKNSIKSEEVTVQWTYGYYTGPTTFSLEITDKIWSKKTTQNCISKLSPTNRSCTAVDLRPYWKYSFVVIAKTNISAARSISSETITTLDARPGRVQNLTNKKKAGDDCTEDIYGVKWTEPSLQDRHGNIIQYNISAGRYSMTKTITNTGNHQNTRKQFEVFFAKTGSGSQNLTVSVVTVTETGRTSDKRIVSIHIPPCSPGISGGMVAVIILVVICMAAIIIFTALLYKWNLLPCLNKTRSMTITGISTSPSRHIKRERPFVLGSIKQLVDRMKKDSLRLFMMEWDDLNSLSPEYPTEVAKMATNVPKNRYNNILPFDRSRVKLCGGGNDYINANYIPGFKFEREYIACQGPLPGTIADFWQMVWEQDVPIIVMLTGCTEGNTVKCEQYWPEELDEPEIYGTVEVTRTVSEHNNDYVYSEFTIASEEHEKSIKHFHFLEWPDFSADLDCDAFLNFLFRVKSEIHDDLVGPIVVHCSAGVGRTGTYLAIDYLTEFVKTHNLSEEFDIFQLVLKIRQHRTKMVQAKEQYIFIHECLRELVKRQMTVENLSNDGLQMPSEEEYSEQLFDPEDKLMIEEDDNNDVEDGNFGGYENPSMTTEL